MAQPKEQKSDDTKATFKLTKLKEAHLSSITCVDWSPALPNRIMSGSEVRATIIIITIFITNLTMLNYEYLQNRINSSKYGISGVRNVEYH